MNDVTKQLILSQIINLDNDIIHYKKSIEILQSTIEGKTKSIEVLSEEIRQLQEDLGE